MKNVLATVAAFTVVAALSTAGFAASSPTRATTRRPVVAQSATTRTMYQVEGKILGVSSGWMDLQVLRVHRGTGLKVGRRLHIAENASTKIMRSGKPATLATGETVDVSGQMTRSGKSSAFMASAVTIVK